MFPLRLVTATVLTGVAIAVPSTLCSRDSTAANVSTPAAACQDSSFFTQLVDHNDTTSSNATFLQQYELITEYYAPGGPILFYQGAEESNMTCLNVSAITDWAKDVGGIVATLEHRYFGSSLPFGDDSFTPENLVHLSLDNIMADSVAFIDWVKATVANASDSTVVVIGGSYGGLLSAALRVNYPDVFSASVVGQAPILALNLTDESPYRFGGGNWTSSIYHKANQGVATKIRSAFQSLNETLAEGNFTAVQKGLNLCNAPNVTTAPTLTSILVQIYETTMQFNFAAFNYPWDQLLGNLTEMTDSSEILKTTLPFLGAESGISTLNASCFDLDAASNVQAAFGIGSAFQWIQCRHFATYQSNLANNTMFLPLDPPNGVEQLINSCQARFNITPFAQDEMAELYHISVDDFVRTGRMLFTQSEWDPNSGATVNIAEPASGDTNASRTLFMAETGHGAELFPQLPGDTNGTIAARAEILQAIKDWL